MGEKKYDCWVLGERGGPKWPTMAKASLARVMQAVIETGSKIHSTYRMSDTYQRSSVLYSLEVPVGEKEKFESIAGSPLTRHPDISVGFDVHKSVKQVVYEEPQ